ncbi:hypothetical protein EMCRGX_G019603 [Ephydatia muelleri]
MYYLGSCNSPVIFPSNNITSFVGNETAVFNCTGNGSNIFWLVDGQSINAVVIQQRGVKAAQAQFNGSLIYSSLTISKTENNNGTEVKCLVIDYNSITTVSAPVILTLQGTLGAPSEFSVRLTSSTSFVYFWRPPFSLNITRSSAVFFYHICTNVSMLKCSDVTDAAECDFTNICNRTINFTNMITNVEAICSIQTPVLFTIVAVNGAGIGNSSYYIFDPKSDTSCLTTSLVVGPSTILSTVHSSISATLIPMAVTSSNKQSSYIESNSVYSTQRLAGVASAIAVPLLTIHLVTTIVCIIKNYTCKKQIPTMNNHVELSSSKASQSNEYADVRLSRCDSEDQSDFQSVQYLQIRLNHLERGCHAPTLPASAPSPIYANMSGDEVQEATSATVNVQSDALVQSDGAS